MECFDYVIIGSGIAGSSVAYFLSKYTEKILLIDQSSQCNGASKAAGGFLSPLLGKENQLKTEVNNALKFSIQFYQENFPELIFNNGTLRIPKNEIEEKKLSNYVMDFEYQKKDGGYFFPIGSIVLGRELCIELSKKVTKLTQYKVDTIKNLNDIWIINSTLKTKGIIFATGSNMECLPEKYFKIRPVWGQRITIKSDTHLQHSYHKQCSISQTIANQIMIGATHHRFVHHKELSQQDTNQLIKHANDILSLKNIKCIDSIGGARSCSEDYFPFIGKIIDTKKTLQKYPNLIHGVKIDSKNYIYHNNLYAINGLGSRGYVFGPYLANFLVNFIMKRTKIPDLLNGDRFFTKEVKRKKHKE